MRNTTSKAGGGILVALLLATCALAQHGAVVVAPINNWSYLRHSSTATEGYLRGSASVIQSTGQAAYLNSVAAVNYQEALRRRIENQGLYVQNYLANREANYLFREKYYSSRPPSPEQWARITEAALPDRLGAEHYDPNSGQLVWPHILRAPEYKAFRDRIDLLWCSRTADNSGDGSPSQRELASLIDGMKMLLKGNIDMVSRSQYGAAKGFLVSLNYEAQLSLKTQAVATPSPAARGETPATELD